MSYPPPHPTDARLLATELLEISWSDGSKLHYPPDHLRASCPCAQCAPTVPTEAPKTTRDFVGVRIRSLGEIGSYAFRIAFTDGHELGIYTWPKLREVGFPEGHAPKPLELPVFEV